MKSKDWKTYYATNLYYLWKTTLHPPKLFETRKSALNHVKSRMFPDLFQIKKVFVDYEKI